MSSKKRMYRVEEVAELFGVSDSTVASWCKNGLIPAQKIASKHWIYDFWNEHLRVSVDENQLHRWLLESMPISISPLQILHIFAKALCLRCGPAADRARKLKQLYGEEIRYAREIACLEEIVDEIREMAHCPKCRKVVWEQDQGDTAADKRPFGVERRQKGRGGKTTPCYHPGSDGY